MVEVKSRGIDPEISRFNLEKGQLHIERSVLDGALYWECLQYYTTKPLVGEPVNICLLAERDFNNPERTITYSNFNTDPLTQDNNPNRTISIPTNSTLEGIFSAILPSNKKRLEALKHDILQKKPKGYLGILSIADRDRIVDSINKVLESSS